MKEVLIKIEHEMWVTPMAIRKKQKAAGLKLWEWNDPSWHSFRRFGNLMRNFNLRVHTHRCCWQKKCKQIRKKIYRITILICEFMSAFGTWSLVLVLSIKQKYLAVWKLCSHYNYCAGIHYIQQEFAKNCMVISDKKTGNSSSNYITLLWQHRKNKDDCLFFPYHYPKIKPFPQPLTWLTPPIWWAYWSKSFLVPL